MANWVGRCIAGGPGLAGARFTLTRGYRLLRRFFAWLAFRIRVVLMRATKD